MFRPVWSCILTILGVFLLYAGDVQGQCWESNKCTDFSSEDGILECIKACKMDLSAESPVFPGNGHMQPLSENIRKYVMSHFRWNKFGRKNSTGSDATTNTNANNNNNNAGYKREDIANYPLFSLFPSSDNQITQDNALEDDTSARQDAKRSYSMEHFRWGKPVGRKRRPIKVFPTDAEEESAESYPIELRRELALEFDYPDTDSEEDMDESEMEDSPMKKDGKYKMHHFRWAGPPKDKRYGGFMTPERSQTPLMTLFKNAIIKNAHKKAQ